MYLNDRSSDAPKLKIFLNLDTLLDLRADSLFPPSLVKDLAGRDERLTADGYEGVQLTTPASMPADTRLPFCGLGRISIPADAEPLAAAHAARGDACLTVHVGWGIEDDDAVHRLVEATLEASAHHRLPIFIETHRATITQDLWRTVQITRKFPEVRFNGDFSHYYCGQELVYGDWLQKLAFMQPIFDRIGFLHGRISSPGNIQVPIEADLYARPRQAHGGCDYLVHFRELWTRALTGFLGQAGPGDVLIFAPELLSGAYYYARLFPQAAAGLVEESDRYAQALLHRDLILECFSAARKAFV